ncbi:unnamed protein product [Scytosiphon promiscuus]
MMRDSSGGDPAVSVIPITRSLIFWESSEVCRWLEALQFDGKTVNEVYAKRVTGATLISMVNTDRLAELGITRLKRAQLLWNLERRINKGDQKAGTAVDPTVFLGIEERLSELQQHQEGDGGRGGIGGQRTPYSDNPGSSSSSPKPQMVRAMPSPKRVAGTDGAGDGRGGGGGLPTKGGGGSELLDLMSMDIGGGGVESSSPERAPEGGASGGGVSEETSFLAIEAAPRSEDAPPPAPPAGTEPKKKKKGKSSKGRKTFNLIDFDDEEGSGGDGEGDEEEEEEDSEVEKVAFSDAGAGPEATVFEVVFPPGQTPNILLEESQPGHKLAVKSFPRKTDGSRGCAESTGKIEKGDFLVAVNSIRLEGLGFNDAIRVLTAQGYPLALRFRRVPKHLRAHNLESWSVNALRTVLLEEGVELTGLERHSQLVAMARRTFWNKPVPLPPAPPHVAPGTAAMINGDTSVCGWLLMKGPHDRELQRLFCDLHGNELLYHKPKGGVKGETAGGVGVVVDTAVLVDAFLMKLVATTRSSEEGHRDLRMVNQDEQVYLLSFAKEDALTQWMRKLNTAMIIAGPGARTSGEREPGAPYLVSKTHRSLTVMWLPPRQPYLNSVHSFQVAYKQGINPLKDWTMAADEAHSTKCTIKGLKEGEKYFVKIRAMHELERGQMVWGEWSEHSRPFFTDREVQRNIKPAEHIWVLVHGLRGDSDDMKYLANAISSRHGSSAHVLVSMCNSAPFKTLDGIGKGGTRLYEEVMQTIDSVTSAQHISFVGHGLGGVYARYALRLLNDAGVFSERLSPMNFITLGTPHLGSLMSGGGMAGRVVDNETKEQLFFKDTDMRRDDGGGGMTREEYGVGAGGGPGGAGANSARGGGSGYHNPHHHPGGSSSVLGGTRPPMLARMTGEDFLAPLRLFRRRVLYANVKLDGTVEYPSASVRIDDPFVYVPDTDLSRMCSPHYSHVMANTSKGNLGGMDPGIARGPGGGFPTALAAAAPEPGMWEVMAQVLDSLGWERVDIFNAEGMSPYKDLVVASQWLNSEGADIVRHLVDNHPNKPPIDEAQDEEEEEEEEEVVEDLISGLDDDEDVNGTVDDSGA